MSKIISFGEEIKGTPFKVINEREYRGSAAIMLLLGFIAFVNGFILQNFTPLPYIIVFLMINFIIGIFINPKFTPTIMLAKIFVSNQTPEYVGAIQKKFAWSLGLILTSLAFIVSLILLNTGKAFGILCLLCLICLVLLFLEVAFSICLGCKLYSYSVSKRWIKEKKGASPNCVGDSCKL